MKTLPNSGALNEVALLHTCQYSVVLCVAVCCSVLLCGAASFEVQCGAAWNSGAAWCSVVCGFITSLSHARFLTPRFDSLSTLHSAFTSHKLQGGTLAKGMHSHGRLLSVKISSRNRIALACKAVSAYVHPGRSLASAKSATRVPHLLPSSKRGPLTVHVIPTCLLW